MLLYFKHVVDCSFLAAVWVCSCTAQPKQLLLAIWAVGLQLASYTAQAQPIGCSPNSCPEQCSPSAAPGLSLLVPAASSLERTRLF